MIDLDRRKIRFDFFKKKNLFLNITDHCDYKSCIEIVQCAFPLSLQHDFSWLEESSWLKTADLW